MSDTAMDAGMDTGMPAGKARFLHTMLRVKDLDKSLHFYIELMGMLVI